VPLISTWQKAKFLIPISNDNIHGIYANAEIATGFKPILRCMN
jgi:hypothetical protein